MPASTVAESRTASRPTTVAAFAAALEGRVAGVTGIHGMQVGTRFSMYAACAAEMEPHAQAVTVCRTAAKFSTVAGSAEGTTNRAEVVTRCFFLARC